MKGLTKRENETSLNRKKDGAHRGSLRLVVKEMVNVLMMGVRIIHLAIKQVVQRVYSVEKIRTTQAIVTLIRVSVYVFAGEIG